MKLLLYLLFYFTIKFKFIDNRKAAFPENIYFTFLHFSDKFIKK